MLSCDVESERWKKFPKKRHVVFERLLNEILHKITEHGWKADKRTLDLMITIVWYMKILMPGLNNLNFDGGSRFANY